MDRSTEKGHEGVTGSVYKIISNYGEMTEKVGTDTRGPSVTEEGSKLVSWVTSHL